MQFPAEPSRGQPITAAWAIQVVRCLRMLAITSVVNGSFDRTSNGTSLRCSPKGAAPSENLLPPFWIYQAEPETPREEGDPINTVRVTPGTVGNKLPDDYDDLLTLTGEGLVYVWLEVEADYSGGTFTVTGLELDSGAAVPEDVVPGEGEPPTTFHVLVGAAALDDDGNIEDVFNTLQRSLFPQLVVTDVDCGSVSRALLL